MLMTGRLKIAYYGEEGAYSEQAAIQHFGNSYTLQGYRFLSEIFDVVKNGTTYGIVPIENSTEGPVTQTYDLLLESNLTIVGEEVVKIDHCLIANPGIGMKSIRTVYSHPQALGQCRSYIEKHGFNSIPFYDTAGSVKMIKEIHGGITPGSHLIKGYVESEEHGGTYFGVKMRLSKGNDIAE